MNCDTDLFRRLIVTRRLAVIVCVLGTTLLAACATSDRTDGELLVFAAASLTDAMEDAAAAYEASSDVSVEVSYGPSQGLAQQIARGANPDLYVAAGQQPMDFLQEGGYIADGSASRLLSNKIVLITAADAPRVDDMDGLAASDLKRIAVVDPEIGPAGNYAKASLQNLGMWEQMLPRIVFANDVRVAVGYVQTGNADAAFVYQTDAAGSEDLTILDIVPTDSYPDVVYPAAVVRSTDNIRSAEAMLEFLQSEAAREIFHKHGFTPLQ